MKPRGPVFIGVSTAAALAAAMVGVLFGLGVFTFEYAEGMSYLGTEPETCANCHIMWPRYDSWQRSSHRNVAVCVDCHLPQHGLAKWISKAEQGYNHSRAFTMQDFPEPILMTPPNRQILQDNCIECHGDLTDQLAAGHPNTVECIHCHSGVGHGERAGLGGPARGAELPTERLTQ